MEVLKSLWPFGSLFETKSSQNQQPPDRESENQQSNAGDTSKTRAITLTGTTPSTTKPIQRALGQQLQAKNMPDITTTTPTTAFALCTHLSPPTPRPNTNPSYSTINPSHPFRCFHCDLSYRTSSQSLILDTYNGLISDQEARLYIAYSRKGTDQEGSFDDEMVEEGRRRVMNWEKKRWQEVKGVWSDFVRRWFGGMCYVREGGRGGGLVEREFRFQTVVGNDGGVVVFGLPEDGVGV